MNSNIIKLNFVEFVKRKFQFLDSVFLSLPLNNLEDGKILTDFKEHVYKSFYENNDPETVVLSCFTDRCDDRNIIDDLFQIIKYIEREIVLYDSVEDAAFEKINNLNGPNSLANVIGNAITDGESLPLSELLSEINIRLVLTAHPTQFYPGTILGIINDLNIAIRENNLTNISTILKQLSFTPFFSKQKPTPFDEALSLIWYLENVFYKAILDIQETVQINVSGYSGEIINPELIEMGFWPGGDRDGNPFVTPEITLRVAKRLRSAILGKYHKEIKTLRRKLTFRDVHEKLKFIEIALYRSLYSDNKPEITLDELLGVLREICDTLKNSFDEIYLEEVLRLINTIKIFQYHFASLDIRQDNKTHRAVLMEILESLGITYNYENLTGEEAEAFLFEDYIKNFDFSAATEKTHETLEYIKNIKTIQELNGEKGCCRYIISNCGSEKDIFELIALFIFAGWEKNKITVDFIPLFETISDLKNAASVLRQLYSSTFYREHLVRRNNRQTVMLGFSDGTKDGGYLTANWGIYKAKEELTAVSEEFDIKLTFFDGRGGPAARGGGKTHDFYTSHGESIQNTRIHLTVQGQTVSSNFGTVMSARYNMEQLISASLKNRLYSRYNADFLPEDRQLMEELSRESFEAYLELRSDEKFIPYLVNRSAMAHYDKTNIGSRPDRRNTPENYSLEDLRAIPFVAAWTLNKQNIPGFFGFGSSLEKAIENNKLPQLHDLYSRSLFFRTLIQNSMMVLKKTDFTITSFHSNDEEYGNLWNTLFNEFKKTRKNLLIVSQMETLMEGNPKDLLSVELRENMVLPLCIIHQFALSRLNRLKTENPKSELIEEYTKMIIRSSYGIINAARNSA